MKKCFLPLFGVLVLLSSISVVAFGQSPSSPSQFCDANGNEGLSHDTCVVCVAQGALDEPPVATPTCSCKILEDEGELEAAGFTNLGECISSGFSLLP